MFRAPDAVTRGPKHFANKSTHGAPWSRDERPSPRSRVNTGAGSRGDFISWNKSSGSGRSSRATSENSPRYVNSRHHRERGGMSILMDSSGGHSPRTGVRRYNPKTHGSTEILKAEKMLTPRSLQVGKGKVLSRKKRVRDPHVTSKEELQARRERFRHRNDVRIRELQKRQTSNPFGDRADGSLSVPIGFEGAAGRPSKESGSSTHRPAKKHLEPTFTSPNTRTYSGHELGNSSPRRQKNIAQGDRHAICDAMTDLRQPHDLASVGRSRPAAAHIHSTKYSGQ